MAKEDEGGKVPTIEELQSTLAKTNEQIENLNKGIATYRDESQASKKEAAELKTKVETLEATIKAASDDRGGDDDEKVKLNPEDQKRLEAWAKEQGFVTQKELEVEKSKIYGDTLKNIETQAVDEFLKSHPEYDKDEEWKKIADQFTLYKQPTSLAAYRTLLNKIHKDLNPEDGGARARAEIETKKRLGLGGGSQKTGDEDITIEDLQKKYPRLSKYQIEGKMAELKELYKNKK